MGAQFIKLLVTGCDECPLRTRRATSEVCAVHERELGSDLSKAPDWCPASGGGVTIKLDEMPGDYHRWTKLGEKAIKPQLMPAGGTQTCRRCGLKRMASRTWRAIAGMPGRSQVWVWVYEVDGVWVTKRPGCRKESKDEAPAES